MKYYRVQMMTENDYHAYMCGSNYYRTDYYDVEAEDKAEAIEIAKRNNPSYRINESYVEEIAQLIYIKSEKDKLIAHIANLEKELAEAKEKLARME